jgi:hypothetical protein
MHDLKDSIADTLHIDEFNAKMGDDDDVTVLSFKCKYRDQAADLVNFIEKGYDWILDADVSSGEMEDGSYLVFIEALRRPTLPEKILKLLADLENVTDIPIEKVKFRYLKDTDYMPVTLENLQGKLPESPRAYRKLMKKRDQEDQDLKNMQMQAGLDPSKSQAISDDDIELKNFVNLSKP